MAKTPYIGAQATGFVLVSVAVAFLFKHKPELSLAALGILVILTLGYYTILYR